MLQCIHVVQQLKCLYPCVFSFNVFSLSSVQKNNDWRFETTSGPYSNTAQRRPHHQHRVLRSSRAGDENAMGVDDVDDEDDILHQEDEVDEEDEDGIEGSDDDDDDDDDDLFASTLGSDFLDLFAQNGMMGNENDDEDTGSPTLSPSMKDSLQNSLRTSNVLPHAGSGGLESMSGGPTNVGNLMSLSPRPASVGPPMNTNTTMMASSNSVQSSGGRNSAGRRATTAAHFS